MDFNTLIWRVSDAASPAFFCLELKTASSTLVSILLKKKINKLRDYPVALQLFWYSVLWAGGFFTDHLICITFFLSATASGCNDSTPPLCVWHGSWLKAGQR